MPLTGLDFRNTECIKIKYNQSTFVDAEKGELIQY